jgi:polyhydroxyalkanoate synthesis regulator phasin
MSNTTVFAIAKIRDTHSGQLSKIAGHLVMKGSISQMEAEGLYGVRRLTSRINELKKNEGVQIKTEIRKALNGQRYARYFLVD